MTLISPWGRFDRAAVVARAKEIHSDGRLDWGACMSIAYREASAELRAQFNPVSRVAISQPEAAHA